MMVENKLRYEQLIIIFAMAATFWKVWYFRLQNTLRTRDSAHPTNIGFSCHSHGTGEGFESCFDDVVRIDPV